jgi:hypothetical protein
LIEQDYFRRIVLREHDSAASRVIAPDFIGTAARFALDRGYHVVLEGILSSARYAPTIHDLVATHQGESHVFYLDVSFDETVAYILRASRLTGATATTYCPAICPRCRAERHDSGVAHERVTR